MLPIHRLLAPNPGPFTGTGTNTYLLGEAEVVVVDPGPELPRHLDAILAALQGRRVAAILVTHAHHDHSALARRLAQLTGAEVLAFGGATAGMTAQMLHLAAEGLTGGEGSDVKFAPDRTVVDGQVLSLAGLQIEVIHTPGHMGSHISLALGQTLLSGDHVMGWSTSLVSPPEGDMAAYIASLRKLAGRNWQRFLPGHGEAIEAPATRLSALISHRLARETAILTQLAKAPATATELATQIYTATPQALLAAATRNVLAHLIDLTAQGKVAPQPGPLQSTRYSRL